MSHYPYLSTILLASEKPIVRSPAPQRFNQELLARASHRGARRTLLFPCRAANNHRRRLTSPSSQYRWSTTSGEAAVEGSLPTPRYPIPMTTLEEHADPVRQRGTLPEPNLWQQFAREWDMLQARCPMEPRTKPGINLPKISKASKHPGNQSFSAEVDEIRDGPGEGCLNGCCKPADNCDMPTTTFTRPMPGYGGFVPRYPVHPEPSYMHGDQRISSPMCSTSRRTYRGFPKEEYRELTFSHKGPLSKTVTLTYPFNPFNKVIQETERETY